MKRRTFLTSTAVSLGTIRLASRPDCSFAFGANEDIRLGIIGLQRRGPQLIAEFTELAGVRITAVCDCDTEFLDREAKNLSDQGIKARKYVDYRRLLDDDNVDAVVIATPDHWHALMTIHACQAGKDVYVEKPVSHNMAEGRKMVKAARKYDRIVQAGTQERSDVGLIAAAEYMASGALGNMQVARAYCRPFKRNLIPPDGTQQIPKTVDYDLYQGPAPLGPLTRSQLHYDWHFFWDTGTGDTGNRGVHVLDDIWWMSGCRQLPRQVQAFGGRFGWDDGAETPNTHVAWFDAEPCPLMLQSLSLPIEKHLRPLSAFQNVPGVLLFECEGGTVSARRNGASVYDSDGKLIQEFPGDGGRGHYANFLAALRSRNQSDQNAEIAQGHATTSLCHLANISYRIGMPTSANEILAATRANDLLAAEANNVIGHLKANEIDLDQKPIALGPLLTFDPDTERFAGLESRAANALQTREYRPPYTIESPV